jgi:hypothetical protein
MLVSRWLDGHEEQLSLFEDNDEIILRRHMKTLLVSVQLTHDRVDNSLLETWMRLGGASLSHFQGALAQAPVDGALWLIQGLREGLGEKHLLDCLEALLNQRDTWRAMVTHLARPALKFNPTSLRPLPN